MSPYPADLFAATHRGTPGDLDFYRRVCRGAASVLELGCGYGRVLAALCEVVPDVHGLELDPDLLDLAPPTRSHLHLGDMRNFELDRKFDRVLVPHSGIYCMPDDDAVLACLTAARRHLVDDGLLALDAYAADDFHERTRAQHWDDDEEVELSPVHARGRTWRLFERSHWDRSAQRIDVEYRYAADDGSQVRARIAHRYLLRPQLERLVAQAGFVLQRVGGDFEGGRWQPDGSTWVATASPRQE